MKSSKKHSQFDWELFWSSVYKLASQALFILIILCVSATVFYYLFKIPNYIASRSDLGDFADTGVLGDTYGGLLGPVIAFIGVILTFSAFYVQYRANLAQNRNFNIQQFENTFFEMVRLHKDNVAEIDVYDEKGRNAFVELVKDFNSLYTIVRKADKENKVNSVEKTVEITYLLFYYGLSYSNDFIEQEIDKIIGTIHLLPQEYKDHPTYRDSQGRIKLYSGYLLTEIKLLVNEQRKNDLRTPIVDNTKWKVRLKENSGFQSQLGHYFRHLFQTVKYVHNSKFLTKQKKYDYVKVLRAQLSTFEVALLFYNSISTLGKRWELKPEEDNEKNKLITTYNLIKNLPLNGLTHPQIKPKKFYKDVDYETDEQTTT